MKIACGLVLTNGVEFLICHSTESTHWDLPKGINIPGESMLSTCIREVKEETGLDLKNHSDAIIDLGEHSYIQGKNLHLFLLMVDKLPNEKHMKCSTYFSGPYKTGKLEVDDYKYITWEEIPIYMCYSMNRVLYETLLKCNVK